MRKTFSHPVAFEEVCFGQRLNVDGRGTLIFAVRHLRFVRPRPMLIIEPLAWFHLLPSLQGAPVSPPPLAVHLAVEIALEVLAEYDTGETHLVRAMSAHYTKVTLLQGTQNILSER